MLTSLSTKFLNAFAKIGGGKILPHDLRSRFKQTLARLGLYDEPATLLKLDRVYPDDTFIVSYSKSGNTWIRFLIAQMLRPDEVIHFRNIEQYVPNIQRSRDLLDAMPPPRFIKSHWPLFSSYPRFIYVYRDGRDVMVSLYHYRLEHKTFAGTFSEFLRKGADLQGVGVWHEHVNAALAHAEQHPGDVLLLKYEHMLEAPVECATQIAGFCRLPVDQKQIEQAVENCRFDKLQQREKQFGSEYEGRTKQFFRKGKARQWVDYFSPEDMQYFLSVAGPTLRRLGYLED